MIHTILVEDDPMVAQINEQYLERLGDFSVDATFGNGQAALDYLRVTTPDLVILDVYMPVMDGTTLLRRMRTENIRSAVIMVTAATEMTVVEDALRLGIVDYLSKPYSFQRFQEAVNKFLSKASLLKSTAVADQEVVDQLISNGSNSNEPADNHRELHKGLNARTLESLFSYLRQKPDDKHTCESISAASGLSKVTVRRYLNYLIESGQLSSTIDYETGGRPRVLYRLR